MPVVPESKVSPCERAHVLLAKWQVHFEKEDRPKLPHHQNAVKSVFGDEISWSRRLALTLASVEAIAWHNEKYTADVFEALFIVRRSEAELSDMDMEDIGRSPLGDILYPSIISGALRALFANPKLEDAFAQDLPMKIGVLLRDYFLKPSKTEGKIPQEVLGQFSSLMTNYLGTKNTILEEVARRAKAILSYVSVADSPKGSAYPLDVQNLKRRPLGRRFFINFTIVACLG
jgi:hypothetical protein